MTYGVPVENGLKVRGERGERIQRVDMVIAWTTEGKEKRSHSRHVSGRSHKIFLMIVKAG